MSWTMPHRVLQVVALLLILASAGAFAMGMASSLNRGGHLPGDRILSTMTGQAPVEAEDAVPLNNERIEGPPPPAPVEKKAANETADEEDEAETPPAGNAAAAPAPPVLVVPPAGNAAETLAPPSDEPPH